MSITDHGRGAPPSAANGAARPPAAQNGKFKRRQHHNAPDMRPPPPPVGGGMGPMEEQRRGLPVYSFRDSLLETMDRNDVIVVEGETGSGKTTQVPQFCLEQACELGIPCNVVVAQPRRISAMSVAERVAAERGERVGGTVGYTIR